MKLVSWHTIETGNPIQNMHGHKLRVPLLLCALNPACIIRHVWECGSAPQILRLELKRVRLEDLWSNVALEGPLDANTVYMYFCILLLMP